MTPREILATVVREHDAGRRVSLCVIVATRGSTPQSAGALVCIDENANMVGTLGGGCVEADVRRLAHQQIRDATGKLATFALDSDFGYDDGMICGGQMDVAICPLKPTDDIEPYRSAANTLQTDPATFPVRITKDDRDVEYRIHVEPAPTLFIAGAGHISRVLADATLPIGFGVHVIDDRADYANEQRFPPPIHTHVGDIAETLKAQPLDANSYVVIVTRGHKHDEAALKAILTSPAKYLGMIGSRRKIKVVFDDLRHHGADAEALARVHAPIGLDIGAVTTTEIAVSIVAELVKVRRAERHKTVEGPLPIPSATP